MNSLLSILAAGTPDQAAPDSRFGEIGLLIFVGLFTIVLIYTFHRRNRKTFDHARHLPLDDRSLEEVVDDESNSNLRTAKGVL